MEARIKKLPGVNDASMNFIMQKFTLDAEDDRFEEILDEAQKICTKIEADCKIIR